MKKPWLLHSSGFFIGFDPGDPRGDIACLVKMTRENGVITVTEILRGAEAIAEAEKLNPTPKPLA